MSDFTEITLDGCCGQGGKARGLARAGHYIVGVDSDPGCRDGFLRSGAHEFICADILEVLADPGFMARFTYADFSPPCQGYSTMAHCRPEIAGKYPKLIAPIRPLADALGIPYAIENVEGARPELRNPATFCMHMFGRETYRHRLIEAGGGLSLTVPAPPAPRSDQPLGGKVNKRCGWPHPVPTARAGHWKPGYFVSVAGHERKEPVRRVMEIDWMSDREAVAEAIPPYLGYEIAMQLAAWRRSLVPAALSPGCGQPWGQDATLCLAPLPGGLTPVRYLSGKLNESVPVPALTGRGPATANREQRHGPAYPCDVPVRNAV